ncbi:MAG TPA: hypothetical protein PLL10_02570 [Elusimicrobiales bacterium]|nr:hypothetical protein [Elusimicrobiales bacterium]
MSERNHRWSLAMAVMAAGWVAACPALAIDDKAGTGAGTFMKLGLGSPTALALGRAYSAEAEGPSAMVWNPAGTASSQQKEVYFSYLDWIQDYTGKYVAYTQPLGQSVIGVNFGYLGISGFDVRDSNNIPQFSGDTEVRNTFATLTLARSLFNDVLSVGGGIKRVTENNDGSEYTNVVFDLGAQFRPFEFLSFGAAMMNIGNKSEVVNINRFGTSLHLGSFVTVMGEIEQPSDNRSRLGMGVQFTLPEDMLHVGSFNLRVGYYDYDDHGRNYDSSFLKRLGLDNTSKLSFGIGIYTSQLFGYGARLEYAMVPFGTLGKVNQFALGVQF